MTGNPFPFSDDNKRYHTFAYEMQRLFGRRMVKVPLDIGLGCPNRDGRCGYGGCSFCADARGGEFAGDARDPLARQMAEARARTVAKWPSAGLFAYFQAGTNTYAPLPLLVEKWAEALAVPGVEGIFIATRPDCLPPPVLAALASLARRTFLVVELGLQTVHDATAARFGRGYETAVFFAAYRALEARGIRVTVHLIDGLPGEDAAAMVASARQLGQLRPFGVKIHLLHLLAGTRLAAAYAAGGFPLLERQQYADIVAAQLAVLPPETVVERLTGDGDPRALLGPDWSRSKRGVLAAIDRAQRQQESWQGRDFIPPPA